MSWLTTKRKQTALLIFTGLVLSWERHGIFKSFPSWVDFFASWFFHAIVVLLVSGLAFVAIFLTHEFFLDREYKGDANDLVFYTVMTVLVITLLFAVGYMGGDPNDLGYWPRSPV